MTAGEAAASFLPLHLLPLTFEVLPQATLILGECPHPDVCWSSEGDLRHPGGPVKCRPAALIQDINCVYLGAKKFTL